MSHVQGWSEPLQEPQQPRLNCRARSRYLIPSFQAKLPFHLQARISFRAEQRQVWAHDAGLLGDADGLSFCSAWLKLVSRARSGARRTVRLYVRDGCVVTSVCWLVYCRLMGVIIVATSSPLAPSRSEIYFFISSSLFTVQHHDRSAGSAT